MEESVETRGGGEVDSSEAFPQKGREGKKEHGSRGSRPPKQPDSTAIEVRGPEPGDLCSNSATLHLSGP